MSWFIAQFFYQITMLQTSALNVAYLLAYLLAYLQYAAYMLHTGKKWRLVVSVTVIQYKKMSENNVKNSLQYLWSTEFVFLSIF